MPPNCLGRLKVLAQSPDSSTRPPIKQEPGNHGSNKGRFRGTYPESEPDCVEDRGGNKVPADSLVDLIREPLVDVQASEEKVDDGPDIEGERGRGDIRLVIIRGVWTKGRVEGSGEQCQIDDDVRDLGARVIQHEGHGGS